MERSLFAVGRKIKKLSCSFYETKQKIQPYFQLKIGAIYLFTYLWN
jgi:hypothetical protein